MQNAQGSRPRSFIFSETSDQSDAVGNFDEALQERDRFHSWPFSYSENEAEASLNRLRGVLALQKPPSCLPQHHSLLKEASFSEKSTELSSSPDVFRESQNLSRDGSPSLLSRPQTQFSSHASTDPLKITSRNPVSPVSHTCPHLRRQAAFEDLKLHYTLKEALELLPKEVLDSSGGYRIDALTDQITPCIDNSRRGGVSTDEAVAEGEQSPHRFYNKRAYGDPNLSGNQFRLDSIAKRFIAKVLTKLSQSLTRFQFKPHDSSARPDKHKPSFEIGLPFDPHPLRTRVPEAQSVASLSEDLDSPLIQRNWLERDSIQVRPALLRRLSIIHSFGPTLAESIEDAILKTESPGLPAQCLRTTPCSSFPSAQNCSSSSDRTSQRIRFQEPEKRRFRPNLRIQIPSSPSFGLSAYSRHQPRLLHSPPPPRIPSPSWEQSQETNVSLRGGCLPTSLTRNLPPHRRIDPSYRPADDVVVPPTLWCLAGGRPVLKNGPDQASHNGQAKPKRRFKNKRGLAEVDSSHPPARNTDPYQPLTFGQLRAWKAKSRPADRLDSRTGQMEPIYRTFWQEFAYSITRGKDPNDEAKTPIWSGRRLL